MLSYVKSQKSFFIFYDLKNREYLVAIILNRRNEWLLKELRDNRGFEFIYDNIAFLRFSGLREVRDLMDTYLLVAENSIHRKVYFSKKIEAEKIIKKYKEAKTKGVKWKKGSSWWY